MIRIITVVKTCCGLTRLRHNILTTVMTRIVVDKTIYHAKLQSIC